jgi:2-methylisocitrate lyase-like PEP mutase family enzyme
MIEDQQHPKRCGHAVGKSVVCREEAMSRIQAAVDARHEYGLDILVIARTDARQTHGFTEAVQRCQQFCAIGADITFLEAPETLQEMRQYCQQVPGYKMANMLARGKTPSCTPSQLQGITFSPVCIACPPFKAFPSSYQPHPSPPFAS